VRYYLQLSCDRCDADVYLGPSLTLLEYRGAPVISAFDAEQQTFVCDECQTRHHTGELDLFVEEDNRDE
jgi:hypothetical protein